jgi:hypothetical protein
MVAGMSDDMTPQERWLAGDVDYVTGVYRECVEHPLAGYGSVEELEANYTWPSRDWFDYSLLREQINGKRRKPKTPPSIRRRRSTT